MAIFPYFVHIFFYHNHFDIFKGKKDKNENFTYFESYFIGKISSKFVVLTLYLSMILSYCISVGSQLITLAEFTCCSFCFSGLIWSEGEDPTESTSFFYEFISSYGFGWLPSEDTWFSAFAVPSDLDSFDVFSSALPPGWSLFGSVFIFLWFFNIFLSF